MAGCGCEVKWCSELAIEAKEVYWKEPMVLDSSEESVVDSKAMLRQSRGTHVLPSLWFFPDNN